MAVDYSNAGAMRDRPNVLRLQGVVARRQLLRALSAPGQTSEVLSGTGEWLASSGMGVSDHGALTGLGDDDHTQYALSGGVASSRLTVSGTDRLVGRDTASGGAVEEITLDSNTLSMTGAQVLKVADNPVFVGIGLFGTAAGSLVAPTTPQQFVRGVELTDSQSAQDAATFAFITGYAVPLAALPLSILNGGTGQTSASAALSALGGQPLDSELTAIAGLTSAADRLPYFTGSGTASLATFTSFARTILDDADAATVRSTIGAQASDTELTALASVTSAADALPYFTGSGTATTTTLTSTARTLLDDTSTSAMRTTLGLGSLATLSTVNDGNWSGTDLAIANGGTGQSSQQAALDAITNSASANPGDVLQIGDSGATWANLGPRMTIAWIAPGSSTYTDQPAAINFWQGSATYATVADCSVFTQVRLIAKINTAGVSGSKICMRYKTTSFSGTPGDYSKLGLSATEVYVSLTTGATVATSGWINIETAAISAGDVYLMLGSIDGNGVNDPTVGSVRAEFR